MDSDRPMWPQDLVVEVWRSFSIGPRWRWCPPCVEKHKIMLFTEVSQLASIPARHIRAMRSDE
eukprot:3493307-Heterocapsa_arctica.AAC.1